MKQDENYLPNINLRMQLSKANVTREYMDNLGNGVKLYDTLEDMVKANYPELLENKECNHLYHYYWKKGKCKGSKCSLCGHFNKELKPIISQ